MLAEIGGTVPCGPIFAACPFVVVCEAVVGAIVVVVGAAVVVVVGAIVVVVVVEIVVVLGVVDIAAAVLGTAPVTEVPPALFPGVPIALENGVKTSTNGLIGRVRAGLPDSAESS